MPISPFWKPIDELTAPPAPRVPLRREEEMEPVPVEPAPMPPETAAPPSLLAPRNAQSAKMREFLRARYPQEFKTAMGDFEQARVTPDDLLNQRERAANYGFLGALSEASAGIGNYGGEASKTNVPEYMEGIQKREGQALRDRGALADTAFRRMGAATEGMDALDAADQADARRPFEDQEIRRRSEAGAMDLEAKRRGVASEAEKGDPNSEVSQTMRSLAGNRWKKVFGSDLPPNISASALEKYMPEVAREYSAIMDREFREEQARADRGEREKDRELRERLAQDAKAARAAANESKAGKETVSREDATRKEFNGLPEVQKFNIAKQSFMQMQKSYNVPVDSPTRSSADLSMVYNFMRLQDPTSTVREGEFATAANSGGVEESVRNWYNKTISGEILPQKVRDGFLEQAGNDYSVFRQNYEGARRRYSGIAQERGLNPAMIVGDETQFQEETPTGPKSPQTTTPPSSGRRVWKPGG